MGQYTTVQWQAGDEVTSSKLQQMSQNSEWLKDNIILGNMNFPTNALGAVSNGRSPGIDPIKRMEVIAIRYDSEVPKKYCDVTVKYPPVFTMHPVVQHSLYSWQDVSCVLIDGTKPTQGVFRIFDVHGRTVRHQGELYLTLVGK